MGIEHTLKSCNRMGGGTPVLPAGGGQSEKSWKNVRAYLNIFEEDFNGASVISRKNRRAEALSFGLEPCNRKVISEGAGQASPNNDCPFNAGTGKSVRLICRHYACRGTGCIRSFHE